MKSSVIWIAVVVICLSYFLFLSSFFPVPVYGKQNNLYVNSDYVFSFEIPNGWKISSFEKNESGLVNIIQFYNPVETSGYLPNIRVQVDKLDITFEDYVDEFVEEIDGRGYSIVESNLMTSKSGQLVFFITYEYESEVIPLPDSWENTKSFAETYVLFQENDNVFRLRYFAESWRYSIYLDDFLTVINTWNFSEDYRDDLTREKSIRPIGNMYYNLNLDLRITIPDGWKSEINGPEGWMYDNMSPYGISLVPSNENFTSEHARPVIFLKINPHAKQDYSKSSPIAINGLKGIETFLDLNTKIVRNYHIQVKDHDFWFAYHKPKNYEDRTVDFDKFVQSLEIEGLTQKTGIKKTSTDLVCKGKTLCIIDKVKKIVDGDTIYLKDYKIRLSLTDTPEKGKKGFKEATYFTKKLCPIGSTITVDQDDKQKKDKYGRILGKVYCSGKILNAELLYNNHALISKEFCKKSEFAIEDWAKKYGC